MPRHFEVDLQDLNNPFAICSAQIDRKREPAKWERCVQKVKRRLGMSEKIGETFSVEEFPGGGYLAEFDGEFWHIRDVPFFSELPAGTRSNNQTISKDWMQETISRHRQLEDDQKHLPPVHANHHDSGRDNFRVGFLRPTRVGRVLLDGQLRWTLFGDIVRVEDKHYQEIKDLGYPYRSAEVSRDWKPEIASLALSEDEAPHFKLPMLTIGEERRPFQQEFLPANRPAVAFSEVGESSFICFSFRGTAMTTATKKKIEKFQEEKKKEEEERETLQEEEISADITKVIQDFVKGLPELVRKILEDMLPPMARTAEGELPVEPPMLSQKTGKTAKAGKEQGINEKLLEALSILQGEVAALKDQEIQRVEAAKFTDLAQGEINKLKSEGWHLSDDTEKKIHASAGQGEKSLKILVDSYRETTPKDPPKSLEEIEVFTQDPPELAKYKVKSPEVLEKARTLSKQFDELKDQGAHLSSSREEFIDINLEVA